MADTLTREGTAFGSQPLSPVPQYWNGASYEKVQGANGAPRGTIYNSSGTELFTSTNPANIQVLSSAGGTATLNNGNPGIVELVTSAGGTALFTPTNPGHVEIISSAGNTFTTTSPGLVTVLNSSSGGTAVFANTSPAFVINLSSAGSTTLFTKSNPGNSLTAAPVISSVLYSGTNTWTAGTTATSSQTLNVGIITANITTATCEIFATNDGPYNVTMDIYKTISANGTTFNTASIVNVIIPIQFTSGNVTINATKITSAGLFNVNAGLIIRFTITANITATITNNVIIRETY